MSKATHVVIDGVNYPLDDTTAVDFSEAQSLSAAEKQQARTNIGAADAADVTTIQALIGNTALPTTAQTITGAIAEHETDISDIKSAIGTVPSGSNLQGEVDDLESALKDVETAYNIGDRVAFGIVNKEYVNPSTGAFLTDANWSRSDYISCDGLKYIVFKNVTNTVYNCFYDSNKTRVAGFGIGSSDKFPVQVPQTAKYFVISNTTTALSDMVVYKNDYDGLIRMDLENNLARIQKDELPFSIQKYCYINNATGHEGEFVYDSLYSATSFVAVDVDKLVINASAASVYNAFYDSDKEYISMFTVSNGENIINVPSGAKYCALSFVTDSPIVSIKKYDGEVENSKNLVLFERSKNLFDKTSLNILSDSNISSDGSIISGLTGSSVSDYIPVIPNHRYTTIYINDDWTVEDTADFGDDSYNYENVTSKDRNYVAFYDITKTLIGASSTEPYEIPLTPSNCRYIRVAFDTSKINKLMVVPGSVASGFGQLYQEYEPSTAYTKGIDSSRIASTGEWDYNDKNNTPVQRTMRSIARLGYNVLGIDTPPQHSFEGYKLACEHGFDCLLADLAYTADGVPVCFHDHYIGEVYNIPTYSDGTSISNPNHDITIASHTLAEWNNGDYDFGLYKGSQWAGTKLMTVEEFLRICKSKGKEAYLECKVELTNEQITVLVNVINKTKMAEHIVICTDTSPANVNGQVSILTACPKIKRVAFMPSKLTDNAKASFNAVSNSGAEVIWFGWAEHNLSASDISYLVEHGITYETGTFDTETAIVKWLRTGLNIYCTGVESSLIVASRAISKFAEQMMSSVLLS